MASSNDEQPNAPPVRTCQKHGDYQAQEWKRLPRPGQPDHVVWRPFCPECASEAAANRAREEERRRQQEEAFQRELRLERAGIPARFLGRMLGDYETTCAGQETALAAARDYAVGFDLLWRKGRGLIFLGLPGTGKTHLALAILQTQLTRDVRYVTALDLVREVRGSWRRDANRAELAALDELGAHALLVVDEVGVGYGSDSEQTILFDVIERRYRNQLPTILVSNQDAAGFKACVGERAADRLRETSRVVLFDWPSHRRAPPDAA